MKKRIAIMGSTGSIGTQSLEVIKEQADLFEVEILAAYSNVELLAKQALEFQPNAVVIADDSKYEKLKDLLANQDIKVFSGKDALNDVVQWESVDVVLAAIVGFAGLHSTLSAIKAGKTVALANKETLVVAGEIVMKAAAESNATIIPVDSEHSAIFQCLIGEDHNSIEKIILTASGGPFLGKKPNFLVNVKKSHALEHPNWTMGAKISIDSATLMNKGLEMIEAKHLFALKNDQIDVIVHPQSIIHSFVEFKDSSVKAQLGLPDMKLPIQFALGFPHRIVNNYPRLDFRRQDTLTFEEPDYRTFRNLEIAKNAMLKGGNAPCVLNAANEVAVHTFLDNKLGFLEMSDVIEQVLSEIPFRAQNTLEDLVNDDEQARKKAQSIIEKLQ